MKLSHVLVVCLAVSIGPAALAQKWEFGGGGGGAFNMSNDVNRPTESAKAKIQPGFSAGAWLENNSNKRWGGEIRYAYQNGEMQLTQGSAKAKFSGESHAMHYDFQWHASDVDSPVRAYVAFGGGIKLYRGTGEEQLVQPLSRFALLTKTQQVMGMASVGAGVKMKIGANWQLRVDVHDYLSPYPKEVITPNLGSEIKGWVNNIVPMIGISWTK
ncbi:MAG: outer membrane beta-barrel protein [Acidobacteriota bacterium]